MKAITTTYHGPTNVRGSRIIASDEDGNRVIMPVDNALRAEANHLEACKRLCKKHGWTGRMISGHLRRGMVWVWSTGEEITID